MRTVDPVKHAAKRAAIRDAAAGVFAERGYTGATTAEICRAAGVGSGTLFHYFGDKRSIMLAIFAADRERDTALIDTLDPRHALAEVWRLLDHLTHDATDPMAPGMVVALLQLAVQDEEFGAQLEEGDGHVRRALTRLLRRAAADGDVEVSSPARAARWLQALVDTLYLSSGTDGFSPADDLTELRRLVGRYLGCAVPPAPS